MAKEKSVTANYSATIAEASRELTAKERVMFKDTQNATSMMEFAESAKQEGAKAIITPVTGYVVVDVHNEKSEDVDYKNYIVLGENDQKYVTGSASFWNSFMDIYKEMKDETEPWGIELNVLPSKNYKGKSILTCSLI